MKDMMDNVCKCPECGYKGSLSEFKQNGIPMKKGLSVYIVGKGSDEMDDDDE